jgi:hypothetical protein
MEMVETSLSFGRKDEQKNFLSAAVLLFSSLPHFF